MNWIEEEAEKDSQEKAQKARKNYVVSFSNFWAKLILQITADIERINSHPHWQKNLKNEIKILEIETGYKIVKSDSPALIIYLRNRAGDKEIDYHTKTETDGVFNLAEDVLRVETDGQDLFLRHGRQIFIIPEDASRFVLTPIIEILKG